MAARMALGLEGRFWLWFLLDVRLDRGRQCMHAGDVRLGTKLCKHVCV